MHARHLGIHSGEVGFGHVDSGRMDIHEIESAAWEVSLSYSVLLWCCCSWELGGCAYALVRWKWPPNSVWLEYLLVIISIYRHPCRRRRLSLLYVGVSSICTGCR